jgi:methyl-accepting chemotaxis protein
LKFNPRNNKKYQFNIKYLEEIKEGNLNVFCTVSSNDEIGDIANDLNNTTVELKNLRKGINDKTEEINMSVKMLLILLRSFSKNRSNNYSTREIV